MAPGVGSSRQRRQRNPSISGGSGLENQYVIDGVNVTNTGYGALGSYSIVFGSLGNATPFDFVKEVQVKTGGYEAEFGQSTGGVVNVVTKSGSMTSAARCSVMRDREDRRHLDAVRPRQTGRRADAGTRTSTTPASKVAARSSRTSCSSSARSIPTGNSPRSTTPAGLSVACSFRRRRSRAPQRQLRGQGHFPA